VREQLEGKGPGYVLGNADVDIEITSDTDADTAISAIEVEMYKRSLPPGIEETS